MRSWVRVLMGLAFAFALPAQGNAATDLAMMEPAEIAALQNRLADDGCYAGPIDGHASPATSDAVQACPDQDPVLFIETGMHIAPITRIAANAACRLIVTASEDKTVRLWTLPDGKLQKVIRLPIGPGGWGKVRALALSSDGRFVVAGGWDAGSNKGRGYSLYLVDLHSDAVRRVGTFDNIIYRIAISSDGSRIAASQYEKGIRVIEVATGRELMADQNYDAQTFGAAFATDGSLYTTSYDGYLRRYGPDLILVAKVKAPAGQRPYSAAIDPTGRRLAISYGDSSNVSILDAKTMKPLFKAETRDLNDRHLFGVAWLADGRQLAVGGQARGEFNGIGRTLVRRFNPAGHRLGDTPVSNDTVLDLQSCGTGIVFGTADPNFGLLGADGQARVLQGPTTADMREKLRDAFAVSPDGASVRFGLGYGAAQPMTFNLLAGTLVDALSLPGGLVPTKIDGLPITDWHNTTNPKFDGKSIVLDQTETSRSLAVRPDRTGFALGTGSYLRCFDAEGHEIWQRSTPGTTWGVNFAADSRIVVAAYDDGTIRWHRSSDGQELLTLFVNAADRRWVAWTPTGYYMASPGGEDMIGWHVNRGWEQQADFFPASRFRDKFNRPDIVRTILTTLDETEAVKRADAAAGRRDDRKPLIERLPPVITIVSPSDGSIVAPGMVEVHYQTRMPSGGTVDRVEAFVDGAKIDARGLGASAGASPDAGIGSTITLPMPAHDATISLIAYADGKASDAAQIRLQGLAPSSVGTADVDGILKPTLYALLIGVTHYQTKSYDLAYPAQDAIGVGEALQAQKGRLYKDVVVKVLTDGEATTTAVKRGLSWLRRETTAHDLAVVFAAGHGTTDAKGKFWFLTYDMDPDDVSATAVSREDISDVLFDLPGKKLLFLDACHSGAALDQGVRGLRGTDISAAVSDFSQTEGGVVAYAASTGREFSFENEQWGHGAFTKALIEGFGGKADVTHKGSVTTASLEFYLAERVKELTGGAQHPVMTRPKTVPDFPIAAVN